MDVKTRAIRAIGEQGWSKQKKKSIKGQLLSMNDDAIPPYLHKLGVFLYGTTKESN